MRSFRILKVIKSPLVVMITVLTGLALAAGPAAAAAVSSHAPVLLYEYAFKGTTGTVNNSAPGGPVVPLELSGTWKRVPDGVRFRGNRSGAESVAFGKPASGYTLDEPARNAVGFGTQILYHAPARNMCFSSTPNITQIGRFDARTKSAQAKLQLSSCATSQTGVMMECRFAGATTAPNAPPVVGSLALINDHAYSVRCVKSPDGTDGTATITLTVTDLNAAKGKRTVTNTFTVPALGSLRTRGYVMAGNQYPLPSAANNVNQFTGDMTKTVYCAGSPAAVSTCLAAQLPSR